MTIWKIEDGDIFYVFAKNRADAEAVFLDGAHVDAEDFKRGESYGWKFTELTMEQADAIEVKDENESVVPTTLGAIFRANPERAATCAEQRGEAVMNQDKTQHRGHNHPPLIDKSYRTDLLPFLWGAFFLLVMAGLVGGFIWMLQTKRPDNQLRVAAEIEHQAKTVHEATAEMERQNRVAREVEMCLILCDECDAQFDPNGDPEGNVRCTCICRGGP